MTERKSTFEKRMNESLTGGNIEDYVRAYREGGVMRFSIIWRANGRVFESFGITREEANEQREDSYNEEGYYFIGFPLFQKESPFKDKSQPYKIVSK